MNVRAAAARVLLAVEARDDTLGSAIERWRPEVPERDRALLLELTAGTLRWRNELDVVIAAASQRAVREIDAPALAILRIGVYQLRHLERVPPHAVVHQSVDAMRALDQPKLAGFTNAVLRSVIRRGPAIALPKRPPEDASLDAQVRYCAMTLSHPAWLVRRWIARVGFARTTAWCAFNNASPDITVRPAGRVTRADLLSALDAAGVPAAPAPYAADAIRLPPGSLGRVPEALRDAIVIQDEGAQLVARLADARPGEHVLDACAAPGNKTLVLAADLARGPAASVLVAADVRESRVAALAATVRRLAPSTLVVQCDARSPLPFERRFDCVLLDAPCSGLGTVRRDPDLKWSRTAADLPRLAADQLAMLRACADVVKTGGRLVYATCSSEPEENTAVVDAFLAGAPAFARQAPRPGSPVPDALRSPAGDLVTEPGLHGLDAYFGAVLARRGPA